MSSVSVFYKLTDIPENQRICIIFSMFTTVLKIEITSINISQNYKKDGDKINLTNLSFISTQYTEKPNRSESISNQTL